MSSNNTNDDDGFVFYHYTPSLTLAIVATVIFVTLTGAHVFRMYRSRSWFCIPFIIGGLFESIGYIGRILSHFNNNSLPPYIMQTLLILLAPALFAASIYMTLGRIIVAVNASHHSLIRVSWQTKVFVCGDVLSFLTQMAGGGIMATSSYKLGEKIVIAGLFLQIIFFGFFVVCSTIFHYRCAKRPTVASKDRKMPWQQMLTMLYVVSGLILIRSIFRVVEYIQGNNGALLQHEWPVYAFDGLLMAATMLVFLIWYPSTLKERVKMVGREELGSMESMNQDESKI